MIDLLVSDVSDEALQRICAAKKVAFRTVENQKRQPLGKSPPT